MASYGNRRVEMVLQPVSGKALPVYQGEVLRIIQEEGGACVDFNCFNLHDYKEHMSVGLMRRQGIHIGKGDFVLSRQPHSRLMMVIQEMSEECVTDLTGARCSAEAFEATWGFDIHTNCQDTLAEAIGEYGLIPDDTHDSFNMWMNSGWDDTGILQIGRTTGKKGDYIDLLALMDVLAVPIVCGSGDITRVGNWFLRPMRIQIFEPSAETKSLTQGYLRRWGQYKNQRTVESFRVKDIRTERELRPISGYEPRFINFPLKIQEVEIELTDQDYDQVQRLKMRGLGADDEDAVRSAVMEWYVRNRSERNPLDYRRERRM